jgi:hypothetical protein
MRKSVFTELINFGFHFGKELLCQFLQEFNFKNTFVNQYFFQIQA